MEFFQLFYRVKTIILNVWFSFYLGGATVVHAPVQVPAAASGGVGGGDVGGGAGGGGGGAAGGKFKPLIFLYKVEITKFLANPDLVIKEKDNLPD